MTSCYSQSFCSFCYAANQANLRMWDARCIQVDRGIEELKIIVSERIFEEMERRLSNIYERRLIAAATATSFRRFIRFMPHFILTQKKLIFYFFYRSFSIPPLLYVCFLFWSRAFTKLALANYRHTLNVIEPQIDISKTPSHLEWRFASSHLTTGPQYIYFNLIAVRVRSDMWLKLEAYANLPLFVNFLSSDSCWELVSRKLSASILIRSEIKRRHKHRDC